MKKEKLKTEKLVKLEKLEKLTDVDLSKANLEIIEQFYNTGLASIGYYPALALGIASLVPISYTVYNGAKIICDEFRSPYYGYDRMIKVIQDSKLKDDIKKENVVNKKV